MHLRSRRLAAVAAVIVAVTVTGCGDDDGTRDPGVSEDDPVIVSAAASLKRALTTYGDAFDGGTVRLSFAGSDELAAQIRQGVKPDVFAAANTKLPEQLFAEGLVLEPVVFATNDLVVAVPADGDGRITSLDDLAQDGVTIAVGADGVPVGDYTNKVLTRLAAAQVKAIDANVRSREPDVGGIVGKLTQGAVDAGFVYASDVRGAGGRLKAIALPVELQPTVQYGVAVVKGARNPAGARDFIAGLTGDGAGATALKAEGFGPPPAPGTR